MSKSREDRIKELFEKSILKKQSKATAPGLQFRMNSYMDKNAADESEMVKKAREYLQRHL